MSNGPTPGSGYNMAMGMKAKPPRPHIATNIGPLSIAEDKEYGMLVYYGVRESAPHFELLAQAMQNNTWELLDLDLVETNTLDTLKYLKVFKRYRQLQNKFSALHYTEEGFFIDEHQFETLDEVEKAIKLKAFL